MMNRNRLVKHMYALTIPLFVIGLAGCSSGDGAAGGDKAGAGDASKKQEPVTLRIFNAANTTQYNFETKFKAHVEKKYPHITLEFVLNQKGTTMPELAMTNSLPDIVFGKLSDRDEYMMDLAPLIKKHSFDVTRVKPVLWQTYQFLTDTDKKTLFIPLTTNMHILHYNKSIFDKFGASYPKNGMTWDETFELAKKMTRTDNSVKYMGFNLRANLNLTQGPQLLLPYYDAKTDKAVLNTSDWQRYFANLSRFFTIPGNEVTKAGNELNNDNLFMKDQRVAMYASHPLFSVLADLPKDGFNLNWDMVSLPNYPDKPKQGTSPNTNGLGITVGTKHPDDAFLVIQTLLSDEVQLANAWTGYESVLVKDEKQQKEYGKDYEVLKGKNITAPFYNQYAPTPAPNDFNSAIKGIVPNYFNKVVWREADINTALREAEEEGNKKIEEVKRTLKK